MKWLDYVATIKCCVVATATIIPQLLENSPSKEISSNPPVSSLPEPSKTPDAPPPSGPSAVCKECGRPYPPPQNESAVPPHSTLVDATPNPPPSPSAEHS
jgi:hypothetical protein